MKAGITGNSKNRNMNDKAKDFRTSIIKLIKYCKPFYKIIIVALICASISSIFTIIGPDKLSDLTDL